MFRNFFSRICPFDNRQKKGNRNRNIRFDWLNVINENSEMFVSNKWFNQRQLNATNARQKTIWIESNCSICDFGSRQPAQLVIDSVRLSFGTCKRRRNQKVANLIGKNWFSHEYRIESNKNAVEIHIRREFCGHLISASSSHSLPLSVSKWIESESETNRRMQKKLAKCEQNPRSKIIFPWKENFHRKMNNKVRSGGKVISHCRWHSRSERMSEWVSNRIEWNRMNTIFVMCENVIYSNARRRQKKSFCSMEGTQRGRWLSTTIKLN